MVTNELTAVAAPKSLLKSSPKASLRVLIAEDSLHDFQLCVQTLEKRDWNIEATQVSTRAAFENLVSTNSYDVILADYHLSNWTGMQALDFMKQREIDAPLILVAGPVGEEKAIQCIRDGAADLILKTHINLLPAAVCRAIRKVDSRDAQARRSFVAGK